MVVTNQKVPITGGGSGIGLAPAKKTPSRHNTGTWTGRNRAKLEIVSMERPDIRTFQSDVTQAEGVRKWATARQEKFGGTDVWIHHAGIMPLLYTGDERNDLHKQSRRDYRPN